MNGQPQKTLSLISAGNTYNGCLRVLAGKGYTIGVESSDNSDFNLWWAEKDGMRFGGTVPPELLGVVVLWETFGEDWSKQSPDLLTKCYNESTE